MFPVDFAAPIDQRVTVKITYPETMEILAAPNPVALSLPGNGGKYVVTVQKGNGTLVISSWLTVDRTIYSAEEYHYIRELFNHVVQAQNTEIILRKPGQ